MRKSMSAEEKELKKMERENEKQERIKEVKKSLSNIPDNVLLKFANKLESDYKAMEIDIALNLLFEKFLNGETTFTQTVIWK